jgi:putative salt-induced outer membrane protein YdiY
MKLNVFFGLVILAWVGSLARADQVTFKNGDKLTGTLVNVKGGNIELKSDVVGDVTISLDKVQSFSAAKPAVITVKGKEPVEGNIELQSSGDWQVTEKGKTSTVAAAAVETVMPAETYHTLVEHEAKPWQDWKGSANFGYALQNGDQQTRTITSSIAAVRERPEAPIFSRHWRTNYGLTMLFSNAEESGVSVKSNTISTNLRQDYLFTPNDFVFGLAQLDHIQAQGLYLRQTYGGGYGHDLIHNDRTVFTLLGGITYAHEKFYEGRSDDNAEVLTGEKLGTHLTKRISLDHYFNFYTNLSKGGEYRFDTSTTLGVKLNTRFSLNTGVIDLYLSNPTPGNKNNNVAFTTGIGYTF